MTKIMSFSCAKLENTSTTEYALFEVYLSLTEVQIFSDDSLVIIYMAIS